MFSNLDITSFLQQPKTLLTFALGLLIIVLFAKDKFNVPTHQKILIGPFAQLPPQSLTIDSRYKWGLFVYLSLLIALYTAITIIGAMTANNLDLMGLIQSQGLSPTTIVQPNNGNKPGNSEIWPVIAATFIISTGTAGDSILGRIELYIRQYAHKSAYIPSAVSDLAFSLRNVALDPWLISNRSMRPSDFEERRAALFKLVGPAAAAEFSESPDREGELAAWIRANILFYSLQEMFNNNVKNIRLDNLTDIDDYKTAFDQFQSARGALLAHFSGPERSAEHIPPDDRNARSSQSGDQAAIFSRLVRSLGLLYDNIQTFGSGQESKKANYLAWMLPTVVTFFLAYAFGVGIRFSRVHWLYSEIDREDGQGTKLRELLGKQFSDSLDFDKCLVFPIPALGFVTALEALRYEEYRIKLFGKIQDNQIRWSEAAGKKGAVEVSPPKAAF